VDEPEQQDRPARRAGRVIGCAAVVTIAWYRKAAVQSRYGSSGWDEDEATERGADGMPLSMYAG